MMPIRGNRFGFAMVAVTGVIASLGSMLFKLPNALVMLGVGGALVVMDGLIRLRARPATGWLTQPQFGGFLFVVPAWGAGLIVIAANLINSFLN